MSWNARFHMLCCYSPKAIPRGKWTDKRWYPFDAPKTNQKSYPRVRNETNHDTVSLTQSANGAQSVDTFDARFYDYGISSRRTFSQETVQTLILLLCRVNYQLPSLTSSQWAWFNSVDTRINTNVYERRVLVNRKANSHPREEYTANQNCACNLNRI